MRWLARLLIAATLLAVVIAVVVLAFINPENTLSVSQSLEINHWKFTCFRAVGFGVLIGILFGLRQWNLRRSPRSEPIASNMEFTRKLFRVSVWMIVLELLLGQGLVRRIIEMVSS